MTRQEYLSRVHEIAPRGERLAKKLTESDVRAIRKNRRGLTDKQQADEHGVSASLIYQIRHRIKWGCVR